MTLALLVIVPAVLGLAALWIKRVRLDLAILLGVAVAHLATTALLAIHTIVPSPGLLELDPLGLVFLCISSLLFLLASLYLVPYLLHGTHDEQAAPERIVPCLLWFLAAMTLVTVSRHLVLLWGAVEATTLASAPLVFFYRRPGALEAAWKYLLLCSVGLALALLGTFCIGIAAAAPPQAGGDLSLDTLFAAAPSMAHPWLVAGFVLALVGYGTKMGLVPLHTWLPDTHSQAPSPVSALLSGALLNCALLAILRFYQVCLASGDAEFGRTLFLWLGFLSLGVGAALMVGQKDYKRLLAYSSIENMGVLALGIGLGGGAAFGVLLHAVNHSLGKAGLFFATGNVLRAYGTTEVARVSGAGRRLPRTGVLLGILFLAIGGSPPFGPFMSEFTIFQSVMGTRRMWLGVLFIVLLAIGFLGMAAVFLRMLQGADPDPREAPDRDAALSVLVPSVCALGVVVLGVYVPPWLTSMLQGAAALLGG